MRKILVVTMCEIILRSETKLGRVHHQKSVLYHLVYVSSCFPSRKEENANVYCDRLKSLKAYLKSDPSPETVASVLGRKWWAEKQIPAISLFE